MGTSGHILGKYRLKAEIEFLFEEMKIDIAGGKFEHDSDDNLRRDNSNLYSNVPLKNAQKDDSDWIAEGMLEGFSKHWEIDEQDQVLMV